MPSEVDIGRLNAVTGAFGIGDAPRRGFGNMRAREDQDPSAVMLVSSSRPDGLTSPAGEPHF
jgi:hypothetical protein